MSVWVLQCWWSLLWLCARRVSSVLLRSVSLPADVLWGSFVRRHRAKKVVSDGPRLVDFAIGIVIFVINFPDGQVLFWGEIQITEGL